VAFTVPSVGATPVDPHRGFMPLSGRPAKL